MYIEFEDMGLISELRPFETEVFLNPPPSRR
jgi:hypothetical protein